MEVFKENDLINLSQKNNMDLIHTIDDSVNLEGCYPVVILSNGILLGDVTEKIKEEIKISDKVNH